KTANIWHALELDRRLAADGVRAFAIHPGAIMTELGRHLKPEDIETLRSRASGGGGIRWKQVPQGAATQVWAATAPELEGRGGLYLEDGHVAGPPTDPTAQRGYPPSPSPPASPPRRAARPGPSTPTAPRASGPSPSRWSARSSTGAEPGAASGTDESPEGGTRTETGAYASARAARIDYRLPRRALSSAVRAP